MLLINFIKSTLNTGPRDISFDGVIGKVNLESMNSAKCNVKHSTGLTTPPNTRSMVRYKTRFMTLTNFVCRLKNHLDQLGFSKRFFDSSMLKMEYLERLTNLNDLISKDNMETLYAFLRERSIQRDLALAFATLGPVLRNE